MYYQMALAKIKPMNAKNSLNNGGQVAQTTWKGLERVFILLSLL